MKTKSKMKMTSIYIPPQLLKDIKIHAKKHGTSMAEVIRSVTKSHLDWVKEEKRKPR